MLDGNYVILNQTTDINELLQLKEKYERHLNEPKSNTEYWEKIIRIIDEKL